MAEDIRSCRSRTFWLRVATFQVVPMGVNFVNCVDTTHTSSRVEDVVPTLYIGDTSKARDGLDVEILQVHVFGDIQFCLVLGEVLVKAMAK
jgi:hypothetical protein